MRRSHDAFLSAGADLLQTFSWGLYWGLETKADRQSIMVNAARRAAEAVAATMNWQARRVLIAVALIEGGVDLLVAALAAGMDDMCALLAGIAAANSTALPVLAAYEYEVLGLMSGEDLGNALKSGREIRCIVHRGLRRRERVYGRIAHASEVWRSRRRAGTGLGLRYVGGGWARKTSAHSTSTSPSFHPLISPETR